MKFEELDLSENLKKALKDAGYIEATEIQEKAIPYVLQGRDVIGQSKTGTGKTATYSLPMIERIDKTNKSVQAIILCPTRELAVQVAGVKLDNVKMCILDEADEMLNMGFEEDIETILKEVPEQRQTILFSATMNKKILNIAKKYLNNPKNIKIKSEELTVNDIEQTYLTLKEAMKDETLMRLIEVYNPKKAIVFCNTKRKVDLLIENLKRNNYKAEALHGDITQSQRERIMKRLRNGEFQILVATDVVARGIDVQDLELVINYDVPQEEEYYVHRIGRTGRNGKTGKAITFVVGKEKSKLLQIQKYAKTKISVGKIPTIAEINKIKSQKTIEAVQAMIDMDKFQNEGILHDLAKNNGGYEIVAKALMTMLTANMENKSEITSYKEDKNGNVKLFVSVGKKDNIKAKDIVGSISANTAISGEELGKINVLDKFSFVEVPSRYIEEIMYGMKGKQIKGKDCNIEIANN